MKKINFTNAGGFPLEQETLARLQAAYKDELYEMLKRNFDISNDQNYIISEPTDTINGWFIINGVLHLMEPGNVTPTNFIRTSETITKLRFGDGVYQSAYTDHTVSYVDSIPVDYDSSIEEVGLTDNTIALPNERKLRYYDITNLATNPDRLQRTGFLPINGSKPMEGDLDMGGNQLSNLDTLETEIANLRTRFFNFGYSTERGELGRALVDENITAGVRVDARAKRIEPLEDTALHINYNSDWGTTVIGGEIKLSEFAENSTSLRKSPLLVDASGNVCRGSISENVPLGLIALWYDVNQPIPSGWILCDATNAGQVGSIIVPNLSGNELTPSAGEIDGAKVNYIIYVGRDTPTISAFITDLVRDSKTVVRTLSSGQTSYDATANPFNLEVILENLALQSWAQVSGPTSIITTPNSENTTVIGSLMVGEYVYKVSGIDALGAVYTDQVTINIRGNNEPPIFESIVNTTSGVNITNDMSVVITSDVNQQQARTSFRVGVSDPDGDIFSSNVSVYARIERDGNIIETIQPLILQDVSASRTTVGQSIPSIKYFNFSIQGLIATDTLEFVAIDEGGEETTKSYAISVNVEPNITLLQAGPALATANGGYAKFFDIRVQGIANSTVSLLAERLLSSDIVNTINVSNTGTIPASFNLSTLNRTFNVLLDASGVRVIRVVHEMMIPPLTTINNDTTYALNSRISLASNPSNGLNMRFLYTLSGNPIDIVIDDTPIDDFPIGGGCFDVNTYVLLESGNAKKLSDVQIGEMLIGLDFPNRLDASSGSYFNWIGTLSEASKTPVKVINKKTFTVSSYFEIVTKDGLVLRVTGDHPLLASKDDSQVQWITPQNLNETMSLVDKKGALEKVQSITRISKSLEVATIDVEDVDNYVIGGVIAHNKEIVEGGGEVR